MDLETDSVLLVTPDRNIKPNESQVMSQNAGGIDCDAHRIR